MNRRSGRSIRHSGISKAVRIHTFRRTQRQVEVLTAGKQTARMAAQCQKRRNIIQGFAQEDRDAVQQMDQDAGLADDDDVDAISHTVPPGEEGFDISHEGGEYEVFNDLVTGLVESTGRPQITRVDDRDRRDRVEVQNSYWDIQIPHLVKAYLNFRARSNDEGMVATPVDPEANSPSVITIKVLDIFFRRDVSFHTLPVDVYTNETLLRHGYLGSSPLRPTVAFSIRTLAAYRQAHRTCPRFSIEAQCKMLCHLHNEPYSPYICTLFSNSFDIYLALCRQVDQHVDQSLGFVGASDRLRRSCPPCFYALKDEPALEFSCLVSIDGNNSLKRIGAAVRGVDDRLDTRLIASDRWLTPEEVDRFKDEVKARVRLLVLNVQHYLKPFKPAKHNQDDVDVDDDWEDEEQTTGLSCIERWRNAGPDGRKRMFTLFEETGIFIASCRHRLVLFICDMVKSGELSKYALAIVNRLIDTLGSKIGCAYDIGCALAKTLEHSSLSEKAKNALFRLMVGAFHGHAHNRLCQLTWHPLYIRGTGRTDGEGCEHVFSSSNDLARSTRHATRFHRHQAIEEHFNFWDQDKYANLSRFIQNHYREAAMAVCSLETELAGVCSQLKITPETFEQHFADEKLYLEGFTEPSPTTALKTRYVQALNDLQLCRQEWNNARAAVNDVFTRPACVQIHLVINQVRRRVDTAYTKLQNAETYVETLENSLQIKERWTEASPEYKTFFRETVLTKYEQALDELERLVVMRLFELAKMSSSGIGYKLRRQIGKALQRRSEAIKNAINRYNTQAAKLDPPRPALSWKEIVEYSFIGEFDALRYSTRGVRDQLWAQTLRREATVKYFQLQRAKEEIIRLNVEIRRLRTFIHDETIHTIKTIKHLKQINPDLAMELELRWKLRSTINALHIQRLNTIASSRMFSGSQNIGTCLSASTSATPVENNITQVEIVDVLGSGDQGEVDDDGAGDDTCSIEKITDFILGVTD